MLVIIGVFVVAVLILARSPVPVASDGNHQPYGLGWAVMCLVIALVLTVWLGPILIGGSLEQVTQNAIDHPMGQYHGSRLEQIIQGFMDGTPVPNK